MREAVHDHADRMHQVSSSNHGVGCLCLIKGADCLYSFDEMDWSSEFVNGVVQASLVVSPLKPNPYGRPDPTMASKEDNDVLEQVFVTSSARYNATASPKEDHDVLISSSTGEENKTVEQAIVEPLTVRKAADSSQECHKSKETSIIELPDRNATDAFLPEPENLLEKPKSDREVARQVLANCLRFNAEKLSDQQALEIARQSPLWMMSQYPRHGLSREQWKWLTQCTAAQLDPEWERCTLGIIAPDELGGIKIIQNGDKVITDGLDDMLFSQKSEHNVSDEPNDLIFDKASAIDTPRGLDDLALCTELDVFYPSYEIDDQEQSSTLHPLHKAPKIPGTEHGGLTRFRQSPDVESDESHGIDCVAAQSNHSGNMDEGFYESPIVTTWLSLPDKRGTYSSQPITTGETFKDSGVHIDDDFAKAALPDTPFNPAVRLSTSKIDDEAGGATPVLTPKPSFAVRLAPLEKVSIPNLGLIDLVESSEVDWPGKCEAPYDLDGFCSDSDESVSLIIYEPSSEDDSVALHSGNLSQDISDHETEHPELLTGSSSSKAINPTSTVSSSSVTPLALDSNIIHDREVHGYFDLPLSRMRQLRINSSLDIERSTASGATETIGSTTSGNPIKIIANSSLPGSPNASDDTNFYPEASALSPNEQYENLSETSCLHNGTHASNDTVLSAFADNPPSSIQDARIGDVASHMGSHADLNYEDFDSPILLSMEELLGPMGSPLPSNEICINADNSTPSSYKNMTGLFQEVVPSDVGNSQEFTANVEHAESLFPTDIMKDAINATGSTDGANETSQDLDRTILHLEEDRADIKFPAMPTIESSSEIEEQHSIIQNPVSSPTKDGPVYCTSDSAPLMSIRDNATVANTDRSIDSTLEAHDTCQATLPASTPLAPSSFSCNPKTPSNSQYLTVSDKPANFSIDNEPLPSLPCITPETPTPAQNSTPQFQGGYSSPTPAQKSSRKRQTERTSGGLRKAKAADLKKRKGVKNVFGSPSLGRRRSEEREFHSDSTIEAEEGETGFGYYATPQRPAKQVGKGSSGVVQAVVVQPNMKRGKRSKEANVEEERSAKKPRRSTRLSA